MYNKFCLSNAGALQFSSSELSVFQVLAFIFQHEAICEFPSNTFYDGKLQTAEVVKSREPNRITFWPAMVSQKKDIPIVFCHVEGQEESTPIASPESNQESKWNQKEVLKTVCILHVITDCMANVPIDHIRILIIGLELACNGG